jgi:MFS family permease
MKRPTSSGPPSVATSRLVAVSVGWLGISMIADGVPTILLPHQLLSAGEEGATMLGLISLVALAGAAAVQPLAGRLSDTIGRWPVVAAGVGLAVAGLVLLTAAALPGAVLAMVGISVAQAGYQPLLPDLVPVRRRGAASGLKSALDVAGATAGFLLLAALLAEGAATTAIVVLAAALAVPFGIAYLLLRDGTTRGGPSNPSSLDMSRLLNGVPPSLVRLVAARFLFLLGIFGVGRFVLLFIGDRLNLGPDAAASQAGIALGALALITVAASVPAGWVADRVGRRGVMLGGGVLAGVGIGLLPTAGSVAMVLAFGSLMALGSAAFSAASWAALTDMTPSADAGRLLGLANLGTAGAAAAAGAFGVLIDAGNAGGGQLGYALAFGLAAASAVVGGSLAWRSVPATSFRSTRLAEVPR